MQQADRAVREQIRKKIEPRWETIMAPSSIWGQILGFSLVLILPSVASLIAQLAPTIPWAVADTIAFAALPALVPGLILVTWSMLGLASAQGLKGQFYALRAPKNSDILLCRQCGGPLPSDGDIVAATCEYCDTESVIQSVPLERIFQARSNVRFNTLARGITALRRRKAIGVVGVMLAFLLVGLASTSVFLTISSMS